MSERDLFEPEKIFDSCDWSSRDKVAETLNQYIGAIIWALAGSVFSEEETVKVIEAFSEAILEDIEVYDYSFGLWDNNIKRSESGRLCEYEFDEDERFDSFIEQIFADDSIDATESSKHGIAVYTMRYDKKDYETFGALLKSNKKYLENYMGEKLYQKIYPVFWLAMLNKRHKRNSDNSDGEECLIWPIRRGTEREQYIFALLSNERKKDMRDGTIFSGIKRVLTKKCKRKGVTVKQYNMRNVKDRHDFVRWMKDYLYEDKTPGNRNKVVFSNNIITVREMLEIGTKRNIDIPAFIFFLDRLTGWIEFYNFVFLQDDDELELGVDEDEDAVLDYVAFKELAEYNHIAFSYVFGKYVRKNKEFKEIYHTIIGEEIIYYVNIAYNRIKHNRQYVRGQGDLVRRSKWYRNIFKELFVNDISKVNKATRMEALNFYDIYITYMR